MKSLFRNMLDVESHFKAMIPEIESFIKAARVVCGVTENISGLVFQSCGADTGVLGMNVRKYRSAVQQINHTHCRQLEENLHNLITEPLIFQLESFEEHRQNLKKYLEQNKALKSLRTNVSRARSGSAKSIKLKQEFTQMSENTKDSNQRLLTDLTTLFESRHDILASPFRHFQKVQIEFLKTFSEQLIMASIQGVGKTPAVRVSSPTVVSDEKTTRTTPPPPSAPKRPSESEIRVVKEINEPTPAPVIPVIRTTREESVDTTKKKKVNDGDDTPELDSNSGGAQLVQRNGKWVLVKRVKKKKKKKKKKKRKKEKKTKEEEVKDVVQSEEDKKKAWKAAFASMDGFQSMEVEESDGKKKGDVEQSDGKKKDVDDVSTERRIEKVEPKKDLSDDKTTVVKKKKKKKKKKKRVTNEDDLTFI